MKKLLYIALNEFALLLKDRMAAIWMIVLPVAMTLIGWLVFGGLGEGGEDAFSMANQIVPGYAVMFAMFTVLSAAGGILEEKERGTFKRLLIAPVPRWSLLGGKLVAQLLLGVGQIGLMFVLGGSPFASTWGVRPWRCCWSRSPRAGPPPAWAPCSWR